MSTEEQTSQEILSGLGLDEQFIDGIADSKRCGLVWTPWMGDWFTSHSPRNDNSNAEGPWEHWVLLALSILQHPATEVVRADAHHAVAGLPCESQYDSADRRLDNDEVLALFHKGGDSA